MDKLLIKKGVAMACMWGKVRGTIRPHSHGENPPRGPRRGHGLSMKKVASYVKKPSVPLAWMGEEKAGRARQHIAQYRNKSGSLLHSLLTVAKVK